MLLFVISMPCVKISRDLSLVPAKLDITEMGKRALVRYVAFINYNEETTDFKIIKRTISSSSYVIYSFGTRTQPRIQYLLFEIYKCSVF